MPKLLKKQSSEERDETKRKLLEKLASLAGNNPENIKKRLEINEQLKTIRRQRKDYIQAQSQDPNFILERQISAERRSAERRSAERRSAERRSAERRSAAERQRKLDNGELVEGTVIYEEEVVPGIISLNRSEASMENMRASNRARYNETKKAHPGFFSSTRKARGRRHKKRKTHKKRKSSHKKSRKH
jgi:hypothetical protein